MSWTPPAIPPRSGSWDLQAAETMQRATSTPFAWGTSDCLSVVRDLCRVMTGVDPWPTGVAYTDEAGAEAALQALGYADVEDALKAVFPVLPVRQARRFDCGIISRRLGTRTVKATVVVNGHIALGRDLRGPVAVSIRELSAAFAIGALDAAR